MACSRTLLVSSISMKKVFLPNSSLSEARFLWRLCRSSRSCNSHKAHNIPLGTKQPEGRQSSEWWTYRPCSDLSAASPSCPLRCRWEWSLSLLNMDVWRLGSKSDPLRILASPSCSGKSTQTNWWDNQSLRLFQRTSARFSVSSWTLQRRIQWRAPFVI